VLIKKTKIKKKVVFGDSAEDILDDTDANDALKSLIAKKYEVIKPINKGTYGCVLKAICRRTKKSVALKLLINQA
jgi:serine/threonine protein kinase